MINSISWPPPTGCQWCLPLGVTANRVSRCFLPHPGVTPPSLFSTEVWTSTFFYLYYQHFHYFKCLISGFFKCCKIRLLSVLGKTFFDNLDLKMWMFINISDYILKIIYLARISPSSFFSVFRVGTALKFMLQAKNLKINSRVLFTISFKKQISFLPVRPMMA